MSRAATGLLKNAVAVNAREMGVYGVVVECREIVLTNGKFVQSCAEKLSSHTFGPWPSDGTFSRAGPLIRPHLGNHLATVRKGEATSIGEELLKRISVRSEIFGGKPIIRDMRVAVEHVLGILVSGRRRREQ